MSSHCPTCWTETPFGRTCFFCRRTRQLAAADKLKTCLRCGHAKPLIDFAGNGRYRVCDLCRELQPMTAEERRISARMAPSHAPAARRARHRRVANALRASA